MGRLGGWEVKERRGVRIVLRHACQPIGVGVLLQLSETAYRQVAPDHISGHG